MFPYRDENQTQRTAIVTMLVIALNVLAWLFVQGAGSPLAVARAVCDLGLIPGELTLSLPPGTRFPMGDGLVCLTDPGRQVSHIFTSMFLHGSWMHLIGNMWFLWVFGDNIEDSMGRVRFVIFYLVCGIAAALSQVALNPASGIPMVGASGAIRGVMGAYLILYPRVRVFCLLILGFFITSIALPSLCGLEIRRAGYVAGLVRDHRAQVLRGESLQAFAITGRLRSRNRQPRTNQASDQTKPVFSFRHATESW